MAYAKKVDANHSIIVKTLKDLLFGFSDLKYLNDRENQ
jgi:hypothetical protein